MKGSHFALPRPCLLVVLREQLNIEILFGSLLITFNAGLK